MLLIFLFKRKAANELRISDWSSDVCSSDLSVPSVRKRRPADPGTGPMSAPRFVSSPRGIAAGILAMVAIVALANYAVQFPINDWLTWGALTYPAAFLVTALTNRPLGPRAARMVLGVGFALARKSVV